MVKKGGSSGSSLQANKVLKKRVLQVRSFSKDISLNEMLVKFIFKKLKRFGKIISGENGDFETLSGEKKRNDT